VIAKFLYQKRGPGSSEPAIWTDHKRIENIVKMLKAVQKTVRMGEIPEENLSLEVVRGVAVNMEPEEPDTMTISFIMDRKAG